MLQKLQAYIKSKDCIVEPSALRLHFNTDSKIKTVFGGAVTVIVRLIVFAIFISKAVIMFNYLQPYLFQLETGIDET